MSKKEVNRKTKILITGANGFVGSNLTKFLSRDSDLEVYAMVRPKAPVNFLHDFQYKSNNKDKWFELIEANLQDEDSIYRAARNKDVIVHLAGMITDWGKRERFWNLNVEGTKTVLKAASKAKVSRVLFLSSLSVHGLKGHKYDNEEAPRSIKNFAYGESKKIGEDLVNEWDSKETEVDSAIIRPGYVIYGPYDKNTFIKTLDVMSSGFFGLINGGKSLVSHVYVENLCYGISKLVKAPKVNGAYNILDGNMTWKEFIPLWTKALSIKPLMLKIPYWVIAPIVALMVGFYKLFGIQKSPPLNFYRIGIMRRDLAYVNAKLKTEIGYEPPISLEEGVRRTVEFYRMTRKQK